MTYIKSEERQTD